MYYVGTLRKMGSHIIIEHAFCSNHWIFNLGKHCVSGVNNSGNLRNEEV